MKARNENIAAQLAKPPDVSILSNSHWFLLRRNKLKGEVKSDFVPDSQANLTVLSTLCVE